MSDTIVIELSGDDVVVDTNTPDVVIDECRSPEIVVTNGENSVTVEGSTDDVSVTLETAEIILEDDSTEVCIEGTGPQGPPGPASGSAFGWAYYVTDTFTEAAPLEIEADELVILPLNKLGPGTDESNLQFPLINHDFINGAGLFYPFGDEDAYTLRLNFKARPLQIGGSLELQLNIGPPIGVIYTKSEPISFEAGSIDSFSFAIPIFTAGTFLANGGQFWLKPNVPIEVFDVDLVVIVHYVEVP